MNSITKRFLECYDALLFHKKIDNAKHFTKMLEISPTAMTEIRKGRANVGVNALQNIVMKFRINPTWLMTGKGQMFGENQIAQSEQEYNLRDKIRFYCRENGITVKELALKIGMTQGNIYSRFKKNSMELDHLTKIAKVFDINVQELVSNNVVSESEVVYQVSNGTNTSQTFSYNSNTNKEEDLKHENSLTTLEEKINYQLEKIQLLQENVAQLKKIILLLEKKKINCNFVPNINHQN